MTTNTNTAVLTLDRRTIFDGRSNTPRAQTWASITELLNARPVAPRRRRQPRLTADRRRQMLSELTTAYTALELDAEAWQGYQNELSVWEETLSDGLERE